MASPIKKINLRDQVYEYLKDAILKQEFKRGENVNLDELGRKLSVSNTPIRESINLLVKEGLIEYRQNSGFFVIDPDEQTVKDILQMVFFIVIAGYRFCYRNDRLGQIIPKMDKQLKLQKELLDEENVLGFVEISHAYERCIIEVVGNKMLLAEYDSKMSLLSFVTTWYSENNLAKLKSIYSQHEKILGLMKENKLDEVVLEMRNHYYKPDLDEK